MFEPSSTSSKFAATLTINCFGIVKLATMVFNVAASSDDVEDEALKYC